MIARRLSYSFLFAAVLALAAPTFAQKPATAPKNATAQCKDDTYSTAKTEKGACSKHGGVKTWFGASAEPAAKVPAGAPVPKTPAAPASKLPVSGKPSASVQPPESATGQCQDGTFTRAKTQQGACSTHGGVKTWFAGAQPPATPASQAAPGNQPRSAPAPLQPASTPTPKGGAAKAATKSAPAGTPENATAKCKDGTYSFAKTHSGACSHHGGVAEWYK
jgi:hypothetical protein